MHLALFVGSRGSDGQFKGVEGVTCIASRNVNQVCQRVVVYFSRNSPQTTFGVSQSALQQRFDIAVAERRELKNARAAHQRGDHFKVGIFRRCTDQDQRAVFDMREERVLLRFVPAVDFIDQKNCASTIEGSLVLRLLYQTAQLRNSGEYCANCLKAGLGRVGNDHRQGGLPTTRRSPKDHRGKAVRADSAPQQPAWPDNLLLADKFIQSSRSHSGGQRSFCFDLVLSSVGEKIGHNKPLYSPLHFIGKSVKVA